MGELIKCTKKVCARCKYRCRFGTALPAMNYTWRYPLWYSHEGYALKTGQKIIKDVVVQTYPDNDGGYWYYDPETGERIIVHE